MEGGKLVGEGDHYLGEGSFFRWGSLLAAGEHTIGRKESLGQERKILGGGVLCEGGRGGNEKV